MSDRDDSTDEQEQPPETIDTKPIREPLETIAGRGYDHHTVFTDWIDLLLYSLQRKDDPYLEILEDYDRGRDRDRGERNADLFSAAAGELLAAMEEAGEDVLGDTYEAFGMQNDAFGQHFTPHNVSKAMAEMQSQGIDESEPPVTIADPACGSGRMLIHSARRVDERTIVFGQDKSETCAKMAALNGCFFNLDGIFVCGDSLTMEKRRAWETSHSPLGGAVTEVDPEEVPWPEAALEETEGPDTSEEAEPPVAVDGGTSRTIDQAGLEEWFE